MNALPVPAVEPTHDLDHRVDWLGNRGEPVSVLFSRTVKEGREADYETWARGITAAARSFPGHLAASVLSVPGRRTYHVLYSFTDAASLDAWLRSGERAHWMETVDQLTEADETPQKLTGLETWFTLPGEKVTAMGPPPRWKMWLVTVAAIYPLILALFGLLAPRITGLPLPLRALVFPVVLVTLMTYAVMPAMTRLLRPWLAPRRRASTSMVSAGTVNTAKRGPDGRSGRGWVSTTNCVASHQNRRAPPDHL